VLLAAPQQPLHVGIVLKDSEQVLEPHRLAWVQEASDRFDVGQHRVVGAFAPCVLLEGAHLLQGLDNRLPEPLMEGTDFLSIGLPQVLLDDRRGVGFDGLCQAGQAYLFGVVGRRIHLGGLVRGLGSTEGRLDPVQG
jgi:hypothetical protein